jgi:hypothetical protein
MPADAPSSYAHAETKVNMRLIMGLDDSGVEIRGRPIVRDHHFLEKDDHVLTDGSPSDNLVFAPILVLFEEGPLSFGRDYHVFQRW